MPLSPNRSSAVATSAKAIRDGRPGSTSGVSPAALLERIIAPVRTSRAWKRPPSQRCSIMARVIASASRSWGSGSNPHSRAMSASVDSASPYAALNSGHSTWNAPGSV
ncbi:hypothetical protein GCM10022224_091240 [Nonomuraea antimicrobica]|uniref:Uncharacterized protein n=1 Tax=Nonomuraea antimicrobica TaxID=561173 RepID=A0ABP7E2V2_9ACTN